MLNLIIAAILIVILAIFKFIFKINFKEIKKLEKNEELEKIVDKFPENIEICKEILKILKNDNVKVEENKESSTSLYIAITNKIVIANLKNSYARIQTIVHECLHSIQPKNLLIFNFIFSNIYLVCFTVLTILTAIGVLKNTLLIIFILSILGFIYYMMRSCLETDAMTKAEFISEKYIEERNICTNEEKEKIISEYAQINKVGILAYNYILFTNCITKIVVYSVISFICNYFFDLF